MKEERIIVEVFDDAGNLVGTFDKPAKTGPLTFPEEEPYRGLSFHISSFLGEDNERIYQFSPDGYELWVRFSQKTKGKTVEYLLDRPYKFVFYISTKE